MKPPVQTIEHEVPALLASVLGTVFGREPAIERIEPLPLWSIDNWLFLHYDPWAAAPWLVWYDLPPDHYAWGQAPGVRLECLVRYNKQRTHHGQFWTALLTLAGHHAHLETHRASERAAREHGHVTGRRCATRVAHAN